VASKPVPSSSAPYLLSRALLPLRAFLGSSIMERNMLLGIKERAEGLAREQAAWGWSARTPDAWAGRWSLARSWSRRGLPGDGVGGKAAVTVTLGLRR
jgi:hypothetical protein